MELWSWALAAIGVAGTFFVGQKAIWGWIVLMVSEVMWVVYAVHTEQYGFIVAAIAYGAVYIKSYLHWKADA
jgi:hypothetical protein